MSKSSCSILVVVLLFGYLTSCGTVPVPAGKSARTSGKPVAKNTTGPQKPPKKPIVIPHVDDDKRVGVTAIPAKEKNTAPKTSIRQHILLAVDALQMGNIKRARQNLLVVRRREPENLVADKLMKQIERPSNSYFGKAHFKYRVRKGDTLSTISRKYLDDKMLFYGLAKYNGMNDPRRLKPGMTIKVPGKRPRHLDKRGIHIPAISTEYKLAKKYYDAGKYQPAMDLLEEKVRTRRSEKEVDLLVLVYSEYAKVLINKADLLNAQNILQKAIKIHPRDKKLRKQLKQTENGLKAENLFEDGLRLLQQDQQLAAFKKFRGVLQYRPNHELARKHVNKIRVTAVDQIHKKAMQAYRQHDLEKAISTWDHLLSIDPDHESAKLYRARSIDLRERVKRLK